MATPSGQCAYLRGGPYDGYIVEWAHSIAVVSLLEGAYVRDDSAAFDFRSTRIYRWRDNP